ncbi:hypothetical protein WA026_011261 [Henosepilachna vigintioctopunctata]|uniref:Grh/CP2 DB domain-containing protein n=1 Tax=Henosepilachna vigintioctopunctata TaxID=420089 RepID=A0AAW1U677_9CUCU
MEYQFCYGNTDLLLEETQNSPNSRNSWVVSPTDSIDNGDDCYAWSELKIHDGDETPPRDNSQRKRKFDKNNDQFEESNKLRRGHFSGLDKDPLAIDVKRTVHVKNHVDAHAGLLKIPVQWHDEIGDLNSDIIDSSLTALDTSNYTMGETSLSISGLTVFKQEAPSPTHDASAMHQMSRRNARSPASAQNADKGTQLEENSNEQQMINSTISQLLNQSGYSNLHNAFNANLDESSPSQEQYSATSTNFTFSEDCRFQYVLAAATSIATKINEDTLTYLNQGQSYEIKLKKLGDLSMYRGKMLRSVIRICFHERRLQYMEKEQMALWQKARPGDRILDVDVPLSYGAQDIIQPANALNLIYFNWDPTKEVGVYIKVNCISTEFTPKKHGGEKGVPFRIQVETYPATEGCDMSKRLHAAACQIKVFKLKGADRKHKQDREKIMKRPISEQEKYQPSYDCTVLNDIASDVPLSSQPIAPLSPVLSESSSNKSNSSPNRTSSHQANPLVLSVMKQQLQHPIVQVVAPLQQVLNTQEPKEDALMIDNREQIKPTSTNQDVMTWLMQNRFQKFMEVFQNFNGHDLLRLSRNDVLQICGEADGIRFFNILHDKAITPRSKIYICKTNSKIFHAVFLSSICKDDLKQELCNIVGLRPTQVEEMYLEGPNNIHIVICNSLIYHIKEESAFAIDILKEDNNYSFLLKPI